MKANISLFDFTDKDEELYFALYGSKNVMRYLKDLLVVKPTKTSFLKLLSTNNYTKGRVIKKITYNSYDVGIISATQSLKGDKWDLGMLLLEDYQSKGIGTKVMQIVMEQLKKDYSIYTFTGTIPHENNKCISMVKKLGFKQVNKKDIGSWIYTFGED